MITLGNVYKDSITGFKGVATAKTEYLNGCVSVLLVPQTLDKSGDLLESHWFDIQRLIDDSSLEVGGPGPTPPPNPTP